MTNFKSTKRKIDKKEV